MTDIQWKRLDEIENWRQKAFVLSRTDRLGRLITKTFDLIQSVVRDGPNAKTLILEVELLKEEQLNAMKTDPNQDDFFRSLFYGLSSSFGSMIESIKERNEEMEFQGNLNALDQGDVNNGNHLDDGVQCFFPEAAAKTELLDSLQELSENDVKPLNLFDLDSETSKENNDMANILIETAECMDQISDEVSAEKNTKDAAEIAQPVRKRRRTSAKTTAKCGDGVDNASDVVDVTTPKVVRSGNCAAGEFSGRKSSTGKCAPGKFDCNKCERAFDTPRGLQHHHSMFHKGFQCGECNRRKKNMENILKHYAEHHPGKTPTKTENTPNAYTSLKCSQCDYQAQAYSKLKLHMRTHTGEKPFTCADCPAKFAHKSNLTEHIRRLHAMKK